MLLSSKLSLFLFHERGWLHLSVFSVHLVDVLVSGAVYLFVSPFSTMTRRTLLMLEVVFLVVEDSILALGPLRVACLWTSVMTLITQVSYFYSNEMSLMLYCCINYRCVYHNDYPAWACSGFFDSKSKCKRSLYAGLGKGRLLFMVICLSSYLNCS